MGEQLRDRVRWELEQGVARITMIRSGAGNALDMAMAEALGEAADRVERGAADGSVRVAVLAAEGKAFCVGGDLQEFAAAEQRDVQVAAVADELHRTILVLRRAAAPVVSVVHGTVAGGGIGMALAADVVLIAEEAKVRLASTAAGLRATAGSSAAASSRNLAPSFPSVRRRFLSRARACDQLKNEERGGGRVCTENGRRS